MKVLLIDDSDNVIQVVLVHRKSGKPALLKGPADFLHGGSQLHRHDVHSRGNHVYGLQVVELDGVGNQLLLLLADASADLGLLHDGNQLVLGVGPVLLRPEQLSQQLFPQGKEHVQRREQPHQPPHNRCRKKCEPFRVFFCNILRRDFPKNKHRHGHHHRRCGRSQRAAQQRNEHHRRNGGHADIGNIVSNENRGQQLVVPVFQLQHQLRVLHVIIGHILHLNAIEGCKRRLRCRKESG